MTAPGWVAAGLAVLFAASLGVGFVLTKPVCGPGCEHPS